MKSKPTSLDTYIKISIIIGILVLSFSIAYYLIIFLPQKERTRVEKEKQIQLVKEKEAKDKEAKERESELQVKITKCFEDGKKFHQDYISSINGTYFESKYNYNKKLDKCLYNGGFMATSGSNYLALKNVFWVRIVKDIYTNETILSVSKDDGHEAFEEFKKQRDELMNN